MKVKLSIGSCMNENKITEHDGKILEIFCEYIDMFSKTKLTFVRLDKKYTINIDGKDIQTDTALLVQ